MKLNVKKALLAGSALAAFSGLGIQAQAADGIQPSTTTTLSSSYSGGFEGNGAAGNPGNPGDDAVQFNASGITVTNPVPYTQTGGQGGEGGDAATPTGQGAIGGAGGQGINIPAAQAGTSSSHPTFNNAGTVVGGHGGDGGNAQGAGGTPGNGGVGGDGIQAAASYAVIDNEAGGTTTGGMGGQSGDVPGGPATGVGQGANGGAGINVTSTASNVTVLNYGTAEAGAAGLSVDAGNNGSDGTGILISGANAALTNESTGIVLGDNGRGVDIEHAMGLVTNLGTILSTGGTGFYTGALLTTLDNTGGTIESTGTGAGLINAAGLTTLTNTSGTIEATDTGPAIVSTSMLGTVTNQGGTISANTGDAIDLTSTSTTGDFDNDGGTISTNDSRGIQQDSGGVLTLLTNNGGLITSAGNNNGFGNGGPALAAVSNQGTITTLDNTDGQITGTGSTGVGVLNGADGFTGGTLTTLINDGGTISTADGGAITNFSSIGTVNNNGGTITATSSGVGLYNFFTGNNPVTPTIGSVTNDGGTIESASGAGIDNQGLITTLNNDHGTITTADGTGLLNTNDGPEGGAGHIVSLTNNDGMISATGAGIALSNDAQIDTLDNTGGTISSASGTAVDNSGTITTLTNGFGGTIEATTGDTIDNSGTITTLANAGTITATGNSGYNLRNLNGGTINTLTNTGTISGAEYVLLNEGTIGTVNNSGTITSVNATGYIALYQGGTMNTLNNSGTIDGVDHWAIYLDDPIGTFDNAGGLITSNNTDNTYATLVLGSDLGADGQTISGGTISNTGAANTSVALNIAAAQTGALILDDVHLIADGDTAGSGHGVAIATGDNQADIGLTDGTVVRGNIVAGNGNLYLYMDGASLTGNVTAGSGDDVIDIDGNGNTLTGNVDLGAGSNVLNIYQGAFTTGGTFTSASTLDLVVDDEASFTVNDAMTLGNGDIDVANSGTLTLNQADVTTTGIFYNEGTTTIGLGRTLTVGSLDTGPNGVLDYRATSVGGTLTTGHIDTGLTAADLSNQTVSVSYIPSGTLDPASRALIATGTGNAVAPAAAVLDNSFLYDFSVVEGTGPTANNLYLAAMQVETLASAADNQNNENVSEVLFGPNINTNDPQIAQIQANLNNAPTRGSYNNVLASTLPTTDNGAPTAATGFTGQVFDVTDSQLAFVETGDPTGVAAGDQTYGLHTWAQAFGQHADQDARSGVDGYRANTGGAALGLDTRDFDGDQLGQNNVFGLSFSYGDSFVNSNDVNTTTTRVNTYQGTLYGNHAFGRTDYFVAGMAAFGYDRNDATRHDVGTITGLDASADYNSFQEASRAEFGKNFRLDGDFAGAILTPIASVDYLHYDADGYTEHGAGGADLHVGRQDQDLLNLGIGGRAAWLLHAQNGMQLKPDIHASYQYDVLDDDKVNTSSSFSAGGGTFSTRGLNPSNSTFDVGAGIKLYNAGRWDFTATYDFTAKPDFTANTGMIRVGYKF